MLKSAENTSNTPTTVAVVISHVLVAIWIMWFNCGKTALGVTNLEEFPDINFIQFDCKKFLYSLKLVPAAVNGLNQAFFYMAVMMVQKDVAKTYTDPAAILAMNYKIFVFAIFG